MAPDYDFVFAGAGVAATALARRLVEAGVEGTMLMLDHRDPDRDDPTIAFWADASPPVPGAVSRSWSRLLVADAGGPLDRPLGPWRYHMMRGRDLRAESRRVLDARGVEHRRARVVGIEDDRGLARLITDAGPVTARWVFDSRFDLEGFAPAPGRIALAQSFHGWWIEAPAPAFVTDRPVFMDFRTGERGSVSFFYLVPESERRALVMWVHMGQPAEAGSPGEYLRVHHGVEEWTVVAEERGRTPMTDHPFARRVGDHTLRIGIAGGRLRPSTGYGYMRMERDADAIVASLRRRGHPFALPRDRVVNQLFDAVLLGMIVRRPELVPALFERLFRYQPMPRILRFLDDRAGVWDLLQIMRSAPLKWPFIVEGGRRLLAWRRSPGSLRLASPRATSSLPPQSS